MSEALRKFLPRAPRYILRPQDRNVMRFSLEDTHGPAGIEQTLLINLSESGLAFLTSRSVRVEVGERIKVEIPIPGGEQIAWWARVVRVQEYEPRIWFSSRDQFASNPRLMVALHFEQLPEAHSRTLRKGIERSFLKAVRDQRYRTWMYYKVFAIQNALQIFAYIALTISAFALLYWLSQPDESYDGRKGAPWGQRFKF